MHEQIGKSLKAEHIGKYFGRTADFGHAPLGALHTKMRNELIHSQLSIK